MKGAKMPDVSAVVGTTHRPYQRSRSPSIKLRVLHLIFQWPPRHLFLSSPVVSKHVFLSVWHLPESRHKLWGELLLSLPCLFQRQRILLSNAVELCAFKQIPNSVWFQKAWIWISNVSWGKPDKDKTVKPVNPEGQRRWDGNDCAPALFPRKNGD